MTDVHTPEQRSRNMAAIRNKSTKPEMRVRLFLHSLGFRFRLHKRSLPGRPDIVLPKYRTIILGHGCFWHRHDCKFGNVKPATRAEFWAVKRKSNTDRDARTKSALTELGWRVLTVWECETKSEAALTETLRELITAKRFLVS
jgi:DNA mismatch endonuclease, patch repair protein